VFSWLCACASLRAVCCLHSRFFRTRRSVRGACEVANGVLVGQRLSGHQVRAPHGHQGARAAQPLAWQGSPGGAGWGRPRSLKWASSRQRPQRCLTEHVCVRPHSLQSGYVRVSVLDGTACVSCGILGACPPGPQRRLRPPLSAIKDCGSSRLADSHALSLAGLPACSTAGHGAAAKRTGLLCARRPPKGGTVGT